MGACPHFDGRAVRRRAGGRRGTGRAAFPPVAIGPEGADDQPCPARRGAGEAEHREPGVTEDAEVGLDAHAQGGAEGRGGEHDGGGDVVGDLLHRLDEAA